MVKAARLNLAEGWTAVARRARPSRRSLRRAERTASCETARPACKAGQPQKKISHVEILEKAL